MNFRTVNKVLFNFSIMNLFYLFTIKKLSHFSGNLEGGFGRDSPLSRDNEGTSVALSRRVALSRPVGNPSPGTPVTAPVTVEGMRIENMKIQNIKT